MPQTNRLLILHKQSHTINIPRRNTTLRIPFKLSSVSYQPTRNSIITMIKNNCTNNKPGMNYFDSSNGFSVNNQDDPSKVTTRYASSKSLGSKPR